MRGRRRSAPARAALRGRLLGIARGWGRGVGPRALLACVPGEQHELGLIAFGLALRTHGWRIEYLGADTPLDTIRDVANTLAVDLVVVSAVTPERVGELVPELRQISHARRLAVGGAGAEGLEATALDALALTDDPVREADRVTALPCSRALRSSSAPSNRSVEHVHSRSEDWSAAARDRWESSCACWDEVLSFSAFGLAETSVEGNRVSCTYSIRGGLLTRREAGTLALSQIGRAPTVAG